MVPRSRASALTGLPAGPACDVRYGPPAPDLME